MEVEIEGDRSLIRYRKTLTKETTRVKNRIKSLPYYEIDILVQFSGKVHWSKGFTHWLGEIALPSDSARMALTGHLEMAEHLRQKQYSMLKEIRK